MTFIGSEAIEWLTHEIWRVGFFILNFLGCCPAHVHEPLFILKLGIGFVRLMLLPYAFVCNHLTMQLQGIWIIGELLDLSVSSSAFYWTSYITALPGYIFIVYNFNSSNFLWIKYYIVTQLLTGEYLMLHLPDSYFLDHWLHITSANNWLLLRSHFHYITSCELQLSSVIKCHLFCSLCGWWRNAIYLERFEPRSTNTGPGKSYIPSSLWHYCQGRNVWVLCIRRTESIAWVTCWWCLNNFHTECHLCPLTHLCMLSFRV